MHRVKRSNIILGAGRILDLYGCIRPARQPAVYRAWTEDAIHLREDGALVTQDLRVAYTRVCAHHGLAPVLWAAEPRPMLAGDETAPLAREALACGALNEKQFASVERESVDDARERRLGMWLGLVVAMAFLFVSGWLIHEGHDIAGGVLGTVDLVGLVAIFVARERTEAARIEGDASDKGKKSPGRGDEE